MESLHHETFANIQFLHTQLAQLDGCTNENQAQTFYRPIYDTIDIAEKSIVRLDELANKEHLDRRRNAKLRVTQLKNDVKSIKYSLSNTHIRLTNRWRAASDREELFQRTFTPNNDAHVSLDDQDLLMNDKLQGSNRGIDELLDHGASVLTQLKSQGMDLTGVRRKVMDIGSYLGLSSTTLGMIEKRLSEDLVIFLILCACCLVFMYVFYSWWHG
uniref:Golgi SNAP receptor complex member 2 n=1 Tax=Rhabditophanes sp. KR3021 TaxID=114890 RepID=A0AC35TJU4_9BILA